MTDEELEKARHNMIADRDTLLLELHMVTAERNRREAIQAAQNTVNNLNEMELDALKNIIGPNSVESSTHIGEIGGTASSIRT